MGDTAKRQVAFWKPYKGTGAAMTIECSWKESGPLCFLSVMPESGERKFDSKKKITTKLGLSDLGEILTVLRNIKQGVGPQDGDRYKGLYHQSTNANTVINFTTKDKGDGYYLNVSTKKDNNQNKLGLSLTLGEGEVLRIFIEEVIKDLFVDTYKSVPANN